MDLFKAIEKRRSIRKFKPEPVAKDDLKKILEAGRLAPSGGNRQPWYFIVVRDLNKEGIINNSKQSKVHCRRRYSDCGVRQAKNHN